MQAGPSVVHVHGPADEDQDENHNDDDGVVDDDDDNGNLLCRQDHPLSKSMGLLSVPCQLDVESELGCEGVENGKQHCSCLQRDIWTHTVT